MTIIVGLIMMVLSEATHIVQKWKGVRFYEEKSMADFSMFPDAVAPQAAQRYEIVKTCPYGNAGDYIDGATSWRNVGIGKNNTFRKITLTAFSNIICAAIGLLSSGVGAALLSAGVKETFNLIKAKAPDANALSLKDYRSVHRLYGFTISSSLSVARHETTYFYESDYTGKIGSSHIYYEKFTY